MSGVILNPFRAEHVGSLLRPAELFKKRTEFEANQCTLEDVKSVEDDAIKKIVQLQREVGMKTITDGELRRGMFFEGVFERLEGMTVMPNRPIETFKPYIPHIALMYALGVKEAETIYCHGKIKRNEPFYADDFTFLKTLVAPEDVKNLKVTMCPPTWFHQRHGSDMTYDLSVYKNDTEYFDDLGKAYQEEISALYALGCRHIQFDDPTFCYFCDEKMISGMEKAGVDHEALLDTYIRAINICIVGQPADLRVSAHLCRGNYKGGLHFSEGSYDRISKKLFNDLNVNTYYLEYDSPRAGTFEALQHLPLGKVAVLGLVTTKSSEMETVTQLKARIEEAVQVLVRDRSREQALNQLCISTQCGFASVWEGNPISEETQRQKLELLVEVAKEIWG